MINLFPFGKSKDKKAGQGPVRFQDEVDAAGLGQSGGDSALSKKGRRSTKKQKKSKKKKKKRHQSRRNPVDLGIEDLPPPEEPIAPTLDETEAILMNLHQDLNEFYNLYKPDNIDEDILTILMQFFIDAGPEALNKKLKAKYGADLMDFREMQHIPPPPENKHQSMMSIPPPPMSDDASEIPPPPSNKSIKPKISQPNIPGSELQKTLERAKRNKLQAEMGINLPPPPPNDPIIPTQYEISKVAASLPRSASKRSVKNTELDHYKQERERASFVADEENADNLDKEKDEDESDSKSNISDLFEESEDILRLSVLDGPYKKADLVPKDYIEAYYSKHDPKKLDNEESIHRFVRWVDKYSLEQLSDKLEGKYGETLFQFEKLAIRRKNLEKCLTDFYLNHDRHKLDTRWTILKILAWTFQHGVPALNKKFDTRYGQPVIHL